MSLELPRLGHEVTVCPDGLTAVAALDRNTYDCVLVDLDMPGLSGIEVIARAKELAPEADAVVLTGKSSLETAVAALRHGAFDYLTKPCKLTELQALLNRVADKRELTNKYRAAKRQLERLEGKSQLVGDSGPMHRVRQLIAKVAPTNSTVLILGETGTGKELVARALHRHSPRRDAPFIAINTAAIPRDLLESELFGHEKGAFTGAVKTTEGKIELAESGTLFLDEVGDIPLPLQVKLLRFLQERVIERVGGRRSIPVDVRIVCATHRDLETMLGSGQFREDLYYRIAEIVVLIPPLAEREGDAILLAHAFLTRFNRELERGHRGFTPDALDALGNWSWPGNVRELENRLKRAVIMSEGPRISAADLDLDGKSITADSLNLKQVREEADKRAIRLALARAENNISSAAKLLGISRPTFYDLIKQYNIRV